MYQGLPKLTWLIDKPSIKATVNQLVFAWVYNICFSKQTFGSQISSSPAVKHRKFHGVSKLDED